MCGGRGEDGRAAVSATGKFPKHDNIRRGELLMRCEVRARARINYTGHRLRSERPSSFSAAIALAEVERSWGLSTEFS